MKVLVTGAEGYIGSVLVPFLVEKGHDVTGLDTDFYTERSLYDSGTQSWRTVRKDIRRVTTGDLRGFDAMVHLAELSNDPLGQLNPKITYQINHEGSVRLAGLCKEVGVRQFVYTSSCSVYGIGTGDDVKTEGSPLNPQTAYAECKVRVENDVSKLADDHFSPTFLRNATAYGPAPRMRFDIVLNNLCGWAWTAKQIRMTSDGTPWRPLVHVLDVCEAISCVLGVPAKVHNQVLNVGDTKENYRVREIAQIVARVFPGCEVSLGAGDKDNRSYRVSFDRIRQVLPEFRCRRTAADGAAELRALFDKIGLTREIFEFRTFTRLKQLQHLISTQRLDKDLFWKT